MNRQIPTIAISSCLLGENVRFNGGHKRNSFCTDTIKQNMDIISFCPETAIGMGVPRKPIRIVQTSDTAPNRIKVCETDNPNTDYTGALYQEGLGFEAKVPSISGFIGTGASPSCALTSAKVYSDKGHPIAKGPGMFTKALRDNNPLLPIEENGRLNDTGIRESFINRVYTYHRWQQLQEEGLSARALVAFHSQHKYLIMSHSNTAYKTLGQLVAGLGKHQIEQQAQEYIEILMSTLSTVPSRGQQSNVLQHLMGHLKKYTDKQEKQELLKSIIDFQKGIVPLIVPITLLKHHFSRHESDQQYAIQQFYLAPHPYEMGLRSHIN